MMVTGRRTCYVFEQGIVRGSNRRLRAATWPRGFGDSRSYSGERGPRGATLDRYEVVLDDGTKIVLPVGNFGDTANPFETEVERVIAQTGIAGASHCHRAIGHRCDPGPTPTRPPRSGARHPPGDR